MFPGATRAATASLAGAAFTLTLVFCSAAGADPVTTTTSAAPVKTTTSKPARQIVLIGTAESARSATAMQQIVTPAVRVTAVNGAPRTLPHTGSAAVWLTMLGFALVLLGALALRGRPPQLRWAERS